MYDFKELEKRINEVTEWLKKEFAGIRTGRASTAVVEKILVEAYGMKMPLNQMANISVHGAQTLRIVPWDTSQMKAVEKALQTSDLGLSISADSQGIRAAFPDLSAERREQLKKVVLQRREEARVSLRKERERVWSDIQEKERAGELTEDDKFRLKEELQKKIDQANKEIGELTETKEKEIMDL